MDVLSNKADVEIKEYSSNEPEVEPPRLGRRESEPHSEEICYMRNVLKDNYPDHRVLWDLHHYFYHDGEEIDIVFDISFFLEFKTDGPISSYDSAENNFMVPDMAVNVLSKSTWMKDINEIVEKCQLLQIPIYIVFTPYHVASNQCRAPFLQVYILDSNMVYRTITINEAAAKEGVEGFASDKMISLAPRLNLSVGLELLKEKYNGILDLFRLFFVDLTNNERLNTGKEMSDQRADQAEAERDQAEAERDQAEAERDQAIARANQAETERDQATARAEQAEAKSEHLLKLLKENNIPFD